MDIKVKLAVTKYEESGIIVVGALAIFDMGFNQGFNSKANFNVSELVDFHSLMELNFKSTAMFVFKIDQLVFMVLPINI